MTLWLLKIISTIDSCNFGETWTCQNLKTSEYIFGWIRKIFWKRQNLKMSESELVRVGKCQNLYKPENVRIWKCQNPSEPENVRIWKCQNLYKPENVRIWKMSKIYKTGKCQNLGFLVAAKFSWKLSWLRGHFFQLAYLGQMWADFGFFSVHCALNWP